jgi:hypothetical protein
MMFAIIAACADDTPAPPADAPAADADPADVSGTLRVWSFTDEVERHVAIFSSMFPNVNVEFMITDMEGGAYEEWVLTALAAGGDMVPDVVYLEAGFVRTFVEGPFLMDMSDMLPLANALETFQFTIDIGSYDGEVRAFSYQATPGGMFYRRSMAQEIFGVSEPDDVQALFSDIPTALNSARQIRDQGDNMFWLNHFAAPNQSFFANRDNAWLVDNTLTVDQIVLDYMDFARTVREEGLDANVSNWSQEWFSAMSDDFFDAAGNEVQIFSYFLPTWGLAHGLMNNADGNFGDWGLVPGPQTYRWGGTWMGIPRVANNVDLARLFIETINLNPEVLTGWALGRYTHDYLTSHEVNAGLHAGVTQPAGDFISSAVVAREIVASGDFVGTDAYLFLGGQNSFEIWAVPAAQLDLRLIQATDTSIEGAFGDAVNLYVAGEMTRDEALASFRADVQAILPMVDVGG